MRDRTGRTKGLTTALVPRVLAWSDPIRHVAIPFSR